MHDRNTRNTSRSIVKLKSEKLKDIIQHLLNWLTLSSSLMRPEPLPFGVFTSIENRRIDFDETNILKNFLSLRDFVNLGATNKMNHERFKRFLAMNPDLNEQIVFASTIHRWMKEQIHLLRSRSGMEMVGLQSLMSFMVIPVGSALFFTENYEGAYYFPLLIITVVVMEIAACMMSRQMMDAVMDENVTFMHGRSVTQEDREKIAAKQQELIPHYQRLTMFSHRKLAECTDTDRRTFVSEISDLIDPYIRARHPMLARKNG